MSVDLTPVAHRLRYHLQQHRRDVPEDDLRRRRWSRLRLAYCLHPAPSRRDAQAAQAGQAHRPWARSAGGTSRHPARPLAEEQGYPAVELQRNADPRVCGPVVRRYELELGVRIRVWIWVWVWVDIGIMSLSFYLFALA